jgi:hypothetical protein
MRTTGNCGLSVASKRGRHMRRFFAIATLTAMAPLVAAGVAMAHPHEAVNAHDGDGQVIANGQNHPTFANGESCDSNAHLPGYGPAWYGLETAHHGPDAADPGKGDGCYQIEGGLSPTDPASDRNPGLG